MRLIQLNVGLLRAVDETLDGQLSDAITEVIRSGGDPSLAGIRHRHPDQPSTWTLRVEGASVHRDLAIEPTNHLGLALVVHLHVGDLVDEVRADVGRLLGHPDLDDGLEGHLPWPRPTGGLPS